MKRRFLAYTFDGFITSRMESTTSFIEIEFADIEKHRPIRFNDYTGFTMACMGSIGAAFASPETQEAGETTPSTIFYRPFDAWAPQSDWTVTLPKGEEATCIAIGNTFVAVSTSKWLLRIFSFSGIQVCDPFLCSCLCMCVSSLSC
jgi:chromosome transmission fidelity protein 4